MGLIFFSPAGLKTDEILNATRSARRCSTVSSIWRSRPSLHLPLHALFQHAEVLYGLAICIAPTTLSSGVILTGQAGGNVVFALFLVTNLRAS